jgi:hypothetical protein
VHEYRLFFFDGAARLTVAHEFLASDNAEALRIAEGWREGRQMELWNGGSKIRCWDFPACANANSNASAG